MNPESKSPHSETLGPLSGPAESRRRQRGRQMSHIEGFVQTIGINMGGIYIPNFILTAFLLNIMQASNTLIGFTTSAQFFIGLLQPLASIFLPRLGHRRLMVAVSSTVGRLFFVLAIFMGMFLSGPGAESAFMVILLLGAFSMSFSSMGWSTWMADLVPEAIRGRYFALRNSICAIAGILAPLAGGWLLKTFSGPEYNQTPGFVLVYLIAGASALIGFVLLLFQYDPPSHESPGESVLAGMKEIFKDRNFMSFVRMVMFFNLALMVASPFFSVHFLRVLKLPIDTMAIISALAALAGILGNFFFGKLSEILGNRSIIRLCLLSGIIPTMLMLFIPAAAAIIWSALILILQAFFISGWNLAVFNTSISISPQGRRSVYLGMFNALNSISAILAPLIGGWIMDRNNTSPLVLMDQTIPSTWLVFVLSSVLLFLGLLAFPFYREQEDAQDYSLKDLLFKRNFPSLMYHLFLSTFMPRITSRQKIAEEMGDLKSPATLVPLQRLLGDADPETRLSALEGLGKTGSPRAMEILLDFFPRAGDLEREELLKALEPWAADPRVRQVLLTETLSPYPIMRLRALHSLSKSPKDAEVQALAIKALKYGLVPHPPGTPGLVEIPLGCEEYLAWLDLAMKAGQLAAFGLSKPRALEAQPPEDARYLYVWSQLAGIRKDFYYFLSLDQPEDQESVFRQHLAECARSLIRHPRVKEARVILQRRWAEHQESGLEFFQASRSALDIALKYARPALRDLAYSLVDLEKAGLPRQMFAVLLLDQLL